VLATPNGRAHGCLRCAERSLADRAAQWNRALRGLDAGGRFTPAGCSGARPGESETSRGAGVRLAWRDGRGSTSRAWLARSYMQLLPVHVSPLMQPGPAVQHGCPPEPHARHRLLPVEHCVHGMQALTPGQHGWFDPPHATQCAPEQVLFPEHEVPQQGCPVAPQATQTARLLSQ
jgi:hypothetical protein